MTTTNSNPHIIQEILTDAIDYVSSNRNVPIIRWNICHNLHKWLFVPVILNTASFNRAIKFHNFRTIPRIRVRDKENIIYHVYKNITNIEKLHSNSKYFVMLNETFSNNNKYINVPQEISDVLFSVYDYYINDPEKKLIELKKRAISQTKIKNIIISKKTFNTNQFQNGKLPKQFVAKVKNISSLKPLDQIRDVIDSIHSNIKKE